MVRGKNEKRYTYVRVYIVLKVAIPLVLISAGMSIDVLHGFQLSYVRSYTVKPKTIQLDCFTSPLSMQY
jgi:hypothetical protein